MRASASRSDRSVTLLRLLPGVVWIASQAACQDSGLTRFNSVPEAELLSPSADEVLIEGSTVALRASASDANHDAMELRVAWYAGDALICEAAAPDAEGLSSCSWVVDAQATTVRVEVTDPEGAAGSDTRSFQVEPDAPPEARVLEPVEDGDYTTDVLVTLDGEASDPESPPDELVAEWSSSLDGPLDVAPTIDADGHSRGAVLLSEGQHYLTFTVTDPQGKSTSDTVVATVGPPNSTPECTLLLPAEDLRTFEGQVVDFEATVSDADQAAETLAVTWESDVDGVLAASTPDSDGVVRWSTSELSVASHTVQLVVTDARGASCVSQVGVAVTAAPAVVILRPADGAVVRPGETVTFEGQVSDAEDRASELDLQWQSDLDGVLSTAPADSAGSTLFSRTDLSVGLHTLSLTATDSDGAWTTDAVSLTVDQAPSAPTVRLSPDPATTDDDLVAVLESPSVDPEGDPVTYSYTWLVDGVASTASTTATLPASATSRGQVWTLVVLPSDSVGTGAAGSASCTIANSPPVVSSVVLSPDPATTDSTLSASVSASDADGDAVSLSYQWTVDGAVAGTGATLSGAAFAKHQVVVLQVTPSDGTDAGAAVESAPLEIDNSAPTAPVVVIDPEEPAEGAEDMVCAVERESADADGDTVSYTARWTVDGAAYTDAVTGAWTDDTVPVDDLLEGQEWVCVLTPDDGETTGRTGTARATVGSCPYGLSDRCPAESCIDALASDPTAEDGAYWIDPGTGAVLVQCDMSTDEGGWTLVAVVSDDGTDTWTYTRRRYWDTDTATFGSLESLDHDYKSAALHELPFSDLLFVHQPSGAWAAYDDVGDGTTSLAEVIGGYGDEVCYRGGRGGYAVSAGSVAATGDLCGAELYFNAADHDGTGSCSCSTCGEDAYGPSWSASLDDGCPLDDPGSTSALGPDASAPSTEATGLGFAGPLGLSTGTPGAAENFMWVLVR